MRTIWNLIRKYGSGPLDLALRAAGAVIDAAKKTVVYLCLVLVLAASALADRLDPPDKT